MTDQQRVTDEQLSDWANWGPGMVPPGLFVDVVADLRASRAREAEHLALIGQLRGPGSMPDLERALFGHELTAEDWVDALVESNRARLGLQQRIDKALAVCTAEDELGDRRQGRQFLTDRLVELIRAAALTGTDPDPSAGHCDNDERGTDA